jgi:hypothetical protein
MACSMMLADLVYDVPASVILESAQRAVSGWDLITSMIKSWVFGTIISVVSHSTTGFLLKLALSLDSAGCACSCNVCPCLWSLEKQCSVSSLACPSYR